MPIPKLVATAILMAANVALSAMQTTEGPRLTDTKATVADYGTPVNYVVGTRVVPAHAIFAKDIVEKKKKRKGKGGKQVQYTGYGTFMVEVTGHPADAFERIWLDNHLVYDSTGAGEKIFPLADDYELEAHMRFMLGGEAQEPDPDMLAYIEARDGPGTCPAYRHCAGIYFENIPLENFGNRLPDVKVQVNGGTHGAGAAQLTSVEASPTANAELAGANNQYYSRLIQSVDGSWGFATGLFKTGGFAIDDTAFALSEFASYDGNGFLSANAVARDGTIYYLNEDVGGPGPVQTWSRANGGAGAATAVGAAGDTSLQYYLRGIAENGDSSQRHLVYRYAGINIPAAYEIRDLDSNIVTASSANAQFGEDYVDWWGIAFDEWGDAWVGLVPTSAAGDINSAKMWRIVDAGERPGLADSFDLTGLPPIDAGDAGGPMPSAIAHIDGYFLLQWSAFGTFALCDEDTGAMVASIDLPAVTGYTHVGLDALQSSITADRSAFWTLMSSGDEYYLVKVAIPTMTVESQFRLTSLRPARYAAGSWPVHAAYLANVDGFAVVGVDSSGLPWQDSVEFVFLGGSGEATLGTVLTIAARRAGLGDDEFDFSQATQPIPGYNWTQGTGRQICEHLCDIHDVDLRPHDFLLEALPRGSASQGTIPFGDFAIDDEGPVDRLLPKADEDLPRRLFLTFADVDAGHEPNTAMPVGGPALAAGGSTAELTIDMSTLAETAAGAQQLIERKQRRLRFGRTTGEFALSRRWPTLEPGDVWTPDFDGVSMTMRLTKLTNGADGVVPTEWERDEPRLANLPASQGAPAAGYTDQGVITVVDSLGEVLDLPYLIDAFDQSAPLAVLSAGPAEPGIWLGADFAASDSGELDSYVEGWDGIAAGDGAVIGNSVDALGDALPWVPDTGSSLTIDINSGLLLGATLDELLDDPARNLAAVRSGTGWELVQFMTATLVADHRYTLSGFLRGLRGTEQYIAGHAIGDRFILLDGTARRRTMGAGEIGDTDWYVISTVGQSVDQDSAFTLPFTGASHKPYAAVHGTAVQAGNDWVIGATRRTRIGGGSLNGQDVPLGEASQAWELDILDGLGAVVRTIASVSLPVTYAEADQVTDFGAAVPPGSLDTRLYQINPTLSLRGYPLEISA